MSSIQARFVFVAMLAAVLASGCAVHTQRKTINAARLTVIGAAEVIHATSDSIAEQYAPKPAEDTEAYCILKRSALILTQAKLILVAAEGTIATWEIALNHWIATRDATGKDSPATRKAWTDLLNSNAQWFKYAEQAIAVTKAVIDSLTLYGVKLPGAVDVAWGWIEPLAAATVKLPAWDWTDLEGSVCHPDFEGGVQ